MTNHNDGSEFFNGVYQPDHAGNLSLRRIRAEIRENL